ncbi:chitin synthase-domain-containing protein [Ilyonectria destructans]|nr:chitin synthase-domain-containing protein [Ilyonectria destructans]
MQQTQDETKLQPSGTTPVQVKTEIPDLADLDNGHDNVGVTSKPVPEVLPRSWNYGDTVETCQYPTVEEPVDPARILSHMDLRNQRIIFMGLILLLNVIMVILTIFAKKSKLNLVVVLFIKSKDFLSALISPLGMASKSIYHLFRPLEPVSQRWILSLIPAYSESEEQIVKTVYSLRDNGVEPHRQVMVIVLDGHPRDIRSHMTRVVREFERPYISLKWKRGILRITAGFMEDVPVIVIEKLKNAGKKDSLIFCHDLFNYPRMNSPLYTKLLRQEMWQEILPILTEGSDFNGFDMVFCTDADSTIHKGAIARLANALARDKNAIAACGLVLVELEPGYEWSFWNLYQQFQYTYGQYVRRRAEGIVGKVTCLPGCITMIAVRKEMAGAIQKYAEPVTEYLVLSHQVQYLGTDRRLTYSMLSQGKHLRTLFVPDSVSETVAPQSIQHYLSQRRRWGSNAYFNNYFYTAGENMLPITRIASSIEVIRLSMVYYRVLNTALFLWGLTSAHVTIMQMVPMLIIGQLPSFWFFCSVLLDAELRKRAHKLVIGFSINKLISPIMSLIIFTKVATNLGSQAWGMSGVTASTAAPAAASTAEGSDEESGDLSAAEKGECGLSMTEKSEDDGKRKGPSTKKRRDLDMDIDGDC